MIVYVFKTSITEADLFYIKPILNNLLINCKWNFDFQDVDNILRIESDSDITNFVINELKSEGYFCEELL
jgi:hypothetical protein